MRIEALARRPKVRTSKELSYAGLNLNVNKAVVSCGGRTTQLHEKECRVLELLIGAAPEIVTAQSLSYALWGDEPPESGALRTHIYNLRKSLNDLKLGSLLKTVRGKGYFLKSELADD